MERIVGYLIKQKLEKNYKLFIYKDPRNFEKSMHSHLKPLNQSYIKIIEERQRNFSESDLQNNSRRNIYSDLIFTENIRDVISKYCDTEFTIERLNKLKYSNYF